MVVVGSNSGEVKLVVAVSRKLKHLKALVVYHLVYMGKPVGLRCGQLVNKLRTGKTTCKNQSAAKA